ncbi:hypothetical protein AVEN_104345-1 [Araneus ventricosus]|uniref:Uncharacterized protein n=1 Tax=Araneus ventricosus TaxID=182803 RepID=A0A4Y2BY88_ARAVE|nr:hypothetical protein AVEN_104345-1 [Araneus ventricosus]
MKSTRTRAKNDVIGFRRSEPIILSDFLPQFYQGRVCKYATRQSKWSGGYRDRLDIQPSAPHHSNSNGFLTGYGVQRSLMSSLRRVLKTSVADVMSHHRHARI